jgi:hypothetical protein
MHDEWSIHSCCCLVRNDTTRSFIQATMQDLTMVCLAGGGSGGLALTQVNAGR